MAEEAKRKPGRPHKTVAEAKARTEKPNGADLTRTEKQLFRKAGLNDRGYPSAELAENARLATLRKWAALSEAELLARGIPPEIAERESRRLAIASAEDADRHAEAHPEGGVRRLYAMTVGFDEDLEGNFRAVTDCYTNITEDGKKADKENAPAVSTRGNGRGRSCMDKLARVPKKEKAALDQEFEEAQKYAALIATAVAKFDEKFRPKINLLVAEYEAACARNDLAVAAETARKIDDLFDGSGGNA